MKHTRLQHTQGTAFGCWGVTHRVLSLLGGVRVLQEVLRQVVPADQGELPDEHGLSVSVGPHADLGREGSQVVSGPVCDWLRTPGSTSLAGSACGEGVCLLVMCDLTATNLTPPVG
jgi:hypothetical protein